MRPHDTSYGLREFVYIDPDGIAHRVGSPLHGFELRHGIGTNYRT